MRALLVLGILIASADARADCRIQQWVGTADGTAVPTTGSLFVHDESFAWDDDPPFIELDWTGTGSATVSRVGRTVARIDYTGDPKAELEVRLRFREESYHYKLDQDWAAPTKTPRVLQFWHDVSSWTCSDTDSLMIQLDQPTAAVRARWTYDGRTVEVIETARTDGTKAVIELGKINCGRISLPPEQLADGGALELYAIRFDGTEVRIRNMPVHVSTAEMVARDDSFEGAFTIVTTTPKSARPAHPQSKWVGAAVLLLLAFGGFLGMRLRVGAPSEP